MVWLGQSVRTTVVTRRYPELAKEPWMVSLGDAVHRPRLIEKVFRADIRAHIAVNGPLMLDSGGFTMMMHDRGLAWIRLHAYTATPKPSCASRWIARPSDPIVAASATNQYRKTQDNLAALIHAVEPRRIVPVVHGATEEEVEKNCLAISELLPRPKLICLGGLVPLLRRSMQRSVERAQSIVWLRTLVSTVRNEFPKSVIHILGAGSPQNVATAIACGADSTDSLAWRRAAGFGTVYLPGTSERFSFASKSATRKFRRTVSSKELQLLEACVCPACTEWSGVASRVVGLSNSYLARAAHNAFVVLAQARSARPNHL